mgnify:CR=1 FL=1
MDCALDVTCATACVKKGLEAKASNCLPIAPADTVYQCADYADFHLRGGLFCTKDPSRRLKQMWSSMTDICGCSGKKSKR